VHRRPSTRVAKFYSTLPPFGAPAVLIGAAVNLSQVLISCIPPSERGQGIAGAPLRASSSVELMSLENTLHTHNSNIFLLIKC